MSIQRIQNALLSVYYKDKLAPLARALHQLGIQIYTTGGTQTFLEKMGIPCIPVESVTGFPSILGGRVKTLHPLIFGGILAKRSDAAHLAEMKAYKLPEIDLVVVDLYPFEETVASGAEEKDIIEKIDVGGPSMIRAAAKNYTSVSVLAHPDDYAPFAEILLEQKGQTSEVQRRNLAGRAFDVVTRYDVAISQYFSAQPADLFAEVAAPLHPMKYGENPHQKAGFYGLLDQLFTQLQGKPLSYNNLTDVDAAVQVIGEFGREKLAAFAIIKHTNVCGMALKENVADAFRSALAGDPESAFGGVLASSKPVDVEVAEQLAPLFFEVLIAPGFSEAALTLLGQKKNRILLQMDLEHVRLPNQQYKSLLNGVMVQQTDEENCMEWKDSGGRPCRPDEQMNLEFANLVCKHLKSNAIAIVKDMQLIGKGCGQTSRIDALRQALDKARQFGFSVEGSVLASDAFFPFSDCVQMAHEAGITAFIQPGGSIRDKDSLEYAQRHNLVMVLTGTRHFKH